jgi:two-component system, response regulator RegA
MAEAESIAHGNRVLVVEDDATVAALLGRALRKHRYLVETAASVGQALELAGAWRPQAAIVDLRLNGESGLGLLPVLTRELPGIRIVVLTGYASIATAVQAIKLGASDYLTKPADVTDILAALSGERVRPAQEPPTDMPSIRRLEWEYIQKVLAENDGNVSETARVLGIQRRTLQRKLAKRPVNK